MKQANSLKATISVNIKDSLIMIHKNALRVLGNPEFIQILVNPEEKTIVVCRSIEADHLAHPVNPEIFTHPKKSLRIHSYTLLCGLHKIYPLWSRNSTYKISGKFIPNLNVIKFSMKDSIISSRDDKGECDE